MKARDITALEHALGHTFAEPALLEQALTHSSHAREAASQEGGASGRLDNEQMEFLGDAVLGFVTSQELFRKFPHFREGQLSKVRAYLVSEKHLIRPAKQLKLGTYLKLGRGEEKSGGRTKTALLVDALEAVLAALYLDAGLEKTHEFIRNKVLEPELKRLNKGGGDGLPVTDFKSALQESAHALGWLPPEYVLVKERGPEHQKIFTVEVVLRNAGQDHGDYTARGEGATKKQAEQDAARKALEYLRHLNGNNPKPSHRQAPAREK